MGELKGTRKSKIMEEKIKQKIKSIRDQADDLMLSNEATIKQVIVLSFLEILGWNINNFKEVFPEYSKDNKRVDFSLRVLGQNKVFIEVKNPRQDLAVCQEQLLLYSFSSGVEISILTNGFKWWFFLPLISGDWKDRMCFAINIEGQEEKKITDNFIKILSKENIQSGVSVVSLKKMREVYKKKMEEKANNIMKENEYDNLEHVNTGGLENRIRSERDSNNNGNLDLYKAKITERVMLININQHHRENMTSDELYDVTRNCWRVHPERVKHVDYVLSNYRGIVKEVYEVDRWEFAGLVNGHKRYKFYGKVAPAEVRDKYIGNSVAHYRKKGSQSPILYINC